MHFYEIFLLFFIYSFVGWVVEMVSTYFPDRKIVNRGFLMGPYCPIYGFGCLLISLLLSRYKNDPIVLFVMIIVVCSALEYFVSYILEKIFKARWWDYTKYKYNINGRICLETMIPFGILGCLFVYYLHPFVLNIIGKIPSNVVMAISYILLVVFVIDVIISFSVIGKIHISKKVKTTDDTEEITQKVRSYIANYSKYGNRLMRSFPTLKVFKRVDKAKKKEKNK